MRVILIGTPGERARLRAELVARGIEVVEEFDTLVAARMSRSRADATVLAEEFPRGVENPPGDDRFEEPLTPREIDVLELLAEGLTNKGIAERLRISDQTVKFHIASILGKLDAANRTEAVRRAVHRGLISL